MKIVSIVLTLLTCLSLPNVRADETTDMYFDEGSMIIRCGTPVGQENHISDALFKAAFPNWITSLQRHANQGRVARAHYLGVLKEGLFIVVIGDSREEALKNSEIVLFDLGKIMEEAIQKTGDTPPFTAKESCLTGEIGPVAILPM